jgi:hypothetical protein
MNTPSQPIEGVAELKTLTSLGAEGKYLCASAGIPADVLDGRWVVTLDGVVYPGQICEVYAPGTDDFSGWAVVYATDEERASGVAFTKLVRGNFRTHRIAP